VTLPAELGVGADGLLVITGGAFAGADAAQVAALVDAGGFDVVNIAHRDLSGDAAALAQAIGAAKTKFVSASFTLPQGTPWKSHAVIERGAKRVAVIGVATQAAFLVDPMAGVQFVEPREALKKAIAEAGNTDAVVVLADAPLSDAAAWLKEFPQVDAMILSGRGGGRAGIPSLPRVLRTPPGGQALGVLPADKPAFAVTLDSPDEVADAYKQVASRFPVEPKLPKLRQAAPVPPRAAPTALEVNRLTPLGLSASNRAAVVTVQSAGLLDSFAGNPAPVGRQFLVLDLHFRNILTPALVRDQQVPVAYQMQKLSDHVYLVADERRVLRPLPFDAAGMLSTGELMLPRAGTTVGGKLVYEVDAAKPPRELAVRLYDYAHGHAVVPVLARPASEAKPQEKPVSPLAKNEVVEMGAFNVTKADELAGEKAPAGMTFVSVDLRARSQFTFAADAAAFDPKARPGSKTQVGTVADWTEAHRYLQLVAAGERAYSPLAGVTELPDAPRFLPDVLTGGRAVFLAPADATSLELRADFPNAKTPAGQIIKPKGVVLAIEGKRPALAKRPAIASVDDDVYKVAVDGQGVTDIFAGNKAADGAQFLVLDVTVNNVGRQGEFFQTTEQLKCATSDGAQLEVDPATFNGKYRPTELVFIPAGERRTFQVAYRIPAAETKPRLAYGGISLAKVLDLKRFDAAVASATPAPAAPQPAMTDQKQPPAKPAGPTRVATAAPKPAPTSAPAAKPDRPKRPGEPDVKRVPARQARQPGGIAGVGLTPAQVNASIDRGAAFMWKYIKEKDLGPNYAFGHRREHVLAALALVHADAHKKFPDFDATVRRFIATYDVHDISGTYEIGIYMMLVQAYGDPTFTPQLRTAAQWMLDTQGSEGTWGYGFNTGNSDATEKDLRVLKVAGGRPINGK
jgi:hypothetical protein